MSWSKLDDSLSDHPKAIDAGPALALWTRMLAWSARHHTDGYIPERVAMAAATILASDPLSAGCPAGRFVDRLVEVGLWEADRAGWRVHDFSHYHESRAEWEARTAAERERKRRERGMSGRTDAGQQADGAPDSVRTPPGQPPDSPRARTGARAPSPSPSPSPSPTTETDAGGEASPPTARTPRRSSPREPMPFTVGAALEAVAAAAGPARFAFDGKLLGAGHAANLTRLIRKGVSLDDFQLLGEWLAAGQHWSRAAVGPSWLASGTFGEDLAKARTWAASGRPGGHSMPRSPQTVPATPHEAFASETEHTDFRGAKP